MLDTGFVISYVAGVLSIVTMCITHPLRHTRVQLGVVLDRFFLLGVTFEKPFKWALKDSVFA